MLDHPCGTGPHIAIMCQYREHFASISWQQSEVSLLPIVAVRREAVIQIVGLELYSRGSSGGRVDMTETWDNDE